VKLKRGGLRPTPPRSLILQQRGRIDGGSIQLEDLTPHAKQAVEMIISTG